MDNQEIPIKQSNHNSDTRHRYASRHLAKTLTKIQVLFRNRACAVKFKRTAHLKSFLNSVPQCSNSGPSTAGKASLSISSGVSGSSSFIGTEHCKRNRNGEYQGVLKLSYDNNCRHDIKWGTGDQSWTRQ